MKKLLAAIDKAAADLGTRSDTSTFVTRDTVAADLRRAAAEFRAGSLAEDEELRRAIRTCLLVDGTSDNARQLDTHEVSVLKAVDAWAKGTP